MTKFTVLILFSLLFFNSLAQYVPSLEEFKKSIYYITLVKIMPTEIVRDRQGKKNKYYSQESVITNTGDYLIKEELIYNSVKLDSSNTHQMIDLIYSGTEGSGEMLCYEPRHGILVWSETRYLGFIEICFECGKIKTTDGIPTPKNIDYSIFNQLKALFQKFGMIDPVYQPTQKKEKKKKKK